MDHYPDELLLKILAHLDFENVANVRCVNKRLAEVGAEALIRRVRFHCTKESLLRLKEIADHAVLGKYVETVVYEGNVLANVGCVHAYASHYDLDHHRHDRPQPPCLNASPRERRLFERNMTKFHTEIGKRFDKYRYLFDTQQALLKSPPSSGLPQSLPHFPRLTKVVLFTVGRCKHVLSERFLNTFATDCAMPIEHDTRHSKEQLKFLLFNQGQPITTLQQLEAHVVSPKFFTGFLPRESLCQVFQNLRVVELNLRLEKDDHRDLEISTVERCYGGLSKGILRDALASASKLEKLTVNFDDYGFYGPCTDLKNIIGEAAWPNLTLLDLDCLSCTQAQLMDALKRQPALTELRLGFFILTTGKWTAITKEMQTNLKLVTFQASGLLEDPDRMYPMSLIDTDAYMSDFAHFSLSDALDLYVTAGDVEEEYHPLEDDNFADPEELREEFGPFTDSESGDDDSMDCD